jgi:predicted TIM-barrel fold metal-dependent hydrolase
MDFMSTVPALFDVNGNFGKPCTGGSDFPGVRDRLAAMDRLGVSRALVWNTESMQNHALSSNRKLLEEIRQTPGAEGRIFPALTLSSLTLYERDGLETLIGQFRTFPCRALRFTNGSGRLTLMQGAPVVRQLLARKPFIILRHDQATVADILEFAAAFPAVPLILTEAMWPQHAILFDLMRRRKNILCDISWMHTFGTIELMTREFGADRLVFGLGNKSHNGAAIAALARAELTVAQRRQIAHGNLDRLTGLGKTPVATLHWTANTLWPRFLAGGPLADVDIVDAHGHLGPSSGYVIETHEERLQLQVALQAMDRTGIRTFIVSGMQALLGEPVAGNALLESVLRPHAGRVSGYFTFNPFYADDLVSQFDACFAGPVFKGFKTLCDYWKVPITDKRFTPMWRYASRHRLPVLSHTWGGPNNTPALFRDLARRYPRVPFLLGHSGGGTDGRLEAEALARKCPNVYLEWCGSFCTPRTWDETLRTVNPRQIVFGTDAMVHAFDWELGRLLSLDAPDDVLLPILGGNMRRILARREAAPAAPRRKRSLTKTKTGERQ